MWLSKQLLGIFQLAHESVTEMKVELATTKVERDILRRELDTLRVNFDWLRAKVNGLEMERAQLIQKAYNINLPVPTLGPPQVVEPPTDFGFDDVGEVIAKRLGLPTFEHRDDA